MSLQYKQEFSYQCLEEMKPLFEVHTNVLEELQPEKPFGQPDGEGAGSRGDL